MALVAQALKALKLSATASLSAIDAQVALHRSHIQSIAAHGSACGASDEARRGTSELAGNGKVAGQTKDATGPSASGSWTEDKAGTLHIVDVDEQPNAAVPPRTSCRFTAAENLDVYEAAIAAPLPPSPTDDKAANENVEPPAPVNAAPAPAPAKKAAVITALQAAEIAKKKQLEKEEERRKRKEMLEQQRSALAQQKQAAASAVQAAAPAASGAAAAAPRVAALASQHASTVAQQPGPPAAADSGSVLRLKRAIEARQQQEEEKRRKIMGEGAVPEALSLSAATTSLSDNASKPAQSSAAAASTSIAAAKPASAAAASLLNVWSKQTAVDAKQVPAVAKAAPMLPPPPRAAADASATAPPAAGSLGPAARVAATPAATKKPVEAEELVNYEISPYRSGSDDEEEDVPKQKKPIPPWARSDQLYPMLYSQIRQDPDLIFSDNANKTCSLPDIFGATPRGMDYTRRGSSGCWTEDRLTWKEELKFKKVMGFSTYLSPGKSNA